MTHSGPPRPRLALNVGITGHRAHVLPDEITGELENRLCDVFAKLSDAANRLLTERDVIFAKEPVLLRLHTALATGADQIAATSAHLQEYRVRALLPFAPEEYALDFATSSENRHFQQHLSDADEYFALPGDRAKAEHAYVMVGKGIIAAADILIAVWDGGEGNGPGGTAHVVDLAIRAGVPVLHIPVNRSECTLGDWRLITGGDIVEPVARPIGGDGYYDLVKDVLAPHDAIELRDLAIYYGENEQLMNWRIEYPVLLSLLGVRKLGKHPWRQMSIEENIHEKLGAPDQDDPQVKAYNWANFLAIRYAQKFRSGHITNYLLAALAVLVALGGLLLPPAKPFLVMAELAIIGLLFLNTKVGSEGEWHRRWLQYRHLAESLRPLAYLKRTGLAGPPFRSEYPDNGHSGTAQADWTRWYAAAVWRQMQSPVGVADEHMIRQLVDEVQVQQIEPQVAYHRVNAHRMHLLDHRLHEIGNFLMGFVISACLLYLFGYVLAHDVTSRFTYFFVFTTAGLPAVGAAVFGMRGHGEHLMAASRSASTQVALAANEARLHKVEGLEELTAELERTADIMLDDLSEWNVAYRERSLQVPG